MTTQQSTYDAFIHFRATVVRAVAKSWADPAFKEALLTGNTKEVLERAFYPYKYPFRYELAAQDNTADYRPDLVANWVVHKFDRIDLTLPPPPPRDEGMSDMDYALRKAQALAAYNASHVTFLPIGPAK